MDDPRQPPTSDRLTALVRERNREAAVTALEAFSIAGSDQRKRAVQSLRSVATEDPALFDGLVTALVPFLENEKRAVRLSTAKLLVAVAEAEPGAVRPVVESVADRLSDDEEFYYVRARCAETLGYVGLEYPGEVDSPEILADLRVGLEFDEPEVKEKLAKALECVALGDPDRLRHQVSGLADHLDDENALVRYHLCTALVGVGVARPDRLAEAADPLVDRLDDDEVHVRGRAAEALSLLAKTDVDASVPADAVTELAESDEAFVAERAGALAARIDGVDGDGSVSGWKAGDRVGSVESVRETTEAAVEEMTSPDAERQCPHCGIDLPEAGPPFCPSCGGPR